MDPLPRRPTESKHSDAQHDPTECARIQPALWRRPSAIPSGRAVVQVVLVEVEQEPQGAADSFGDEDVAGLAGREVVDLFVDVWYGGREEVN